MQNILTSHTKTHDATPPMPPSPPPPPTETFMFTCGYSMQNELLTCSTNNVQRTMYLYSYACDAERYLLINLYKITSIWPAWVFRWEWVSESANMFDESVLLRSFYNSFSKNAFFIGLEFDIASVKYHKRRAKQTKHHFLLVFINHINFPCSQYAFIWICRSIVKMSKL